MWNRNVCIGLVGALIVAIGCLLPLSAGQIVDGMPEWQRAAGGKMSFEVVSIRPGDPGASIRPSFPLSSDDAYRTSDGSPVTGARFIADFPLTSYISFAYKLQLSPQERTALLAQLPKWASTDLFTIQAKAPIDNPTKNQMRLMVQSLLAERFKFTAHFEKQELPALALTLAKPGTLGPKLILHSEGLSCDSTPNGSGPCETFSLESRPGKMIASSRNTTIDQIATSFARNFGGMPVVDQTGLTGRFDFTVEWMPDPSPTEPAEGTTFMEALHDQLGLKVVSTKARLDELIIGHVERPTLD